MVSFVFQLNTQNTHTERGGGTQAPQAFRRGEHMGRVGFDPRFFPPLIGMACHPCLTLRATSLSRRIPGRDDLGPPVVPGGQGIGLDPERSREWVGDWGGPETVWALLCVAERRATRPNGEWGYSARRLCWATSAQGRYHPQEALYLPTFSPPLIVNKLFSLSLSLTNFSLSLSLLSSSSSASRHATP